MKNNADTRRGMRKHIHKICSLLCLNITTILTKWGIRILAMFLFRSTHLFVTNYSRDITKQCFFFSVNLHLKQDRGDTKEQTPSCPNAVLYGSCLLPLLTVSMAADGLHEGSDIVSRQSAVALKLLQSKINEAKSVTSQKEAKSVGDVCRWSYCVVLLIRTDPCLSSNKLLFLSGVWWGEIYSWAEINRTRSILDLLWCLVIKNILVLLNYYLLQLKIRLMR